MNKREQFASMVNDFSLWQIAGCKLYSVARSFERELHQMWEENLQGKAPRGVYLANIYLMLMGFALEQ